MKHLAIILILGVLIMIIMISHTFSQSRVQRIACLHNQQAMLEAVVSYQADHASTGPSRMRALRNYYPAGDDDFGRCPVGEYDTYYYEPATGSVICPNPGHRP